MFILAFFGIFIYSGLIEIIQCKEIWFVAIDIVTLLICSIMIHFGYKHHKNQTQKILDFKNQNQINNPLSKMWTLILINLLCQVVQLTESLVFYFQAGDQRCEFSNKQTVDDVVKFFFSFFSLHLSFICTIIIFHLRRENQQKSTQTNNSLVRKQTIVSNFIEMTTVQNDSNENPYYI